MERSKEQVVRNLLAAGKFSIAEIANFASVTESFVKKVHTAQKKKKQILHIAKNIFYFYSFKIAILFFPLIVRC